LSRFKKIRSEAVCGAHSRSKAVWQAIRNCRSQAIATTQAKDIEVIRLTQLRDTRQAYTRAQLDDPSDGYLIVRSLEGNVCQPLFGLSKSICKEDNLPPTNEERMVL
jgi:hypothetical protein